MSKSEPRARAARPETPAGGIEIPCTDCPSDCPAPPAPEAPTLAPTGPVMVFNRHVSSVGGVPPGQSRMVDRAVLAQYPWALRAEG